MTAFFPCNHLPPAQIDYRDWLPALSAEPTPLLLRAGTALRALAVPPAERAPADVAQLAQLLAGFPFFDQLPARALPRLAASASLAVLPPGAHSAEAGARVEEVAVLLAGALALHAPGGRPGPATPKPRGADGEKPGAPLAVGAGEGAPLGPRIGVASRGDSLGEEEARAGGVAPATAVAEDGGACVVRVPWRALSDALARPALAPRAGRACAPPLFSRSLMVFLEKASPRPASSTAPPEPRGFTPGHGRAGADGPARARRSRGCGGLGRLRSISRRCELAGCRSCRARLQSRSATRCWWPVSPRGSRERS